MHLSLRSDSHSGNVPPRALRLEYPDKYRLWSELVKANTDRIFVEAAECPRLGERVPVELAVGGVLLVAIGDVVGLRRAGSRFKSGVWVRFDDDEVDKVRRFLGLTQLPDRPVVGRRSPRERCNLALVFVRPSVMQEATVRNLSETGALVETAAPLAGQFVEVELKLDDGTALRLKAELTREGAEGRFIGLRFIDVQSSALGALRAQLERLHTAPSAGRPTVLIADDEVHILDFLNRALARFGYDVVKAKNGTEALGLVRELKPKLVILDILMPGIDGVDVCKSMRADIEMAGIPVIFLSALEPARLHDVADEAGATDYLCKPATLTELLNLVGVYLKTEQARPS